MKNTQIGIIAASLLTIYTAAQADEVKFLCYNELEDCDVIRDVLRAWETETGNTVSMNVVPYDIIRDQLRNQLNTDAAPDVARVTDLGGLNSFFLDLSPYVDRAYWEENYGSTLPWFRRPDGEDKGIYGWIDGLTGTGPYVNVTMFEDAGVEIPGPEATWDDWAAALTKVKDTLGLNAGLAVDRTTHRIAGIAFSYGAKFFDESGKPLLVDDGFRKFSETFVGWHKSGLMPVEGWPAGQGTQFRSATPLFLSGDVAMLVSGSWNISNFDKNITDFDWEAVRAPCGTGGCGSMPGGSAIVAFKETKVPEAAASMINYLAQEDTTEAIVRRTLQIPAHEGLQQRGVDYGDVSPRVSAALKTFALNITAAAKTTPQAFTLQGYAKNFVIYGVVPDYLTKAINGEMTLDDALTAIDADVAAQIAE